MVKWFRIHPYILWSLRLMTALIVLVSLALAGGLWWLSSDAGRSYVQHTVETTLSEGVGYAIDAKGLEFSFPLTASIAELSLADTKGKWLEATNVSIHLIPTPDIRQHLIIRKITATSFKLLRVPESPTQSAASGAAEGESASTNVSILSMDISEFSLASVITGLNADIIASLNGSTGWAAPTEQLEFKAESHIKSGLPELETGDVSLAATFNMPNNMLDMTALKYTHPKLTASGKGKFDLASNTVNAEIHSDPVTLADWIANISGTAAVAANITGTLAEPAFAASVTSKELHYKDTVIPDAETIIRGRVAENNIIGDVAMKTKDADTISAGYKWSSPNVTLSEIKANYLGNSVSGDALINTESMLASGALKAKIPAIEKLKAYLPEPVSGSALVSATLSHDKNVQAASIVADIENIAARDIKVASAHVEAELPDVQTAEPKSIALTLSQARMEDITIAEATLSAANSKNQWQATLAASGDSAGKNFTVSTNANLSKTTADGWNAIFDSLKGSFDNTAFSSAEKVVASISNTEKSISAPKLKIGNSNFAIDAIQKNKSINATILGSHISPAEFGDDLPDELKKSLAAFDLKITGTMDAPVAELNAALAGVKLHADAKESTIKAAADIQNGKAHITASAEDASLLKSNIDATLPVAFSLEPFVFAIEEQSALSGSADIALDVSALSALLLPNAHKLQGKVDGKLSLSGSYQAPIINGAIHFKNGDYTYLPLSIKLQKISATLSAANRVLTLSEFHAEDSKGNLLTAEGNADLTSLENLRYAIAVKAHQLGLINHPNAHGTITGDISLQGNQQAGTLTGNLKSDELEIRLPDRFASSVPELNVVKNIPPTQAEMETEATNEDASPPAYQIAMDMTLAADNKVFVRGWGVDAELQGKLRITGDVSDPAIEGKLSTIRGRYEEFGKQFKLKTAELSFEGDIPPSPYLNIIPAITESDVEVRTVISGPVLDPELKIESTPALPQEEALSMLLFGEDSSKISAIQAAQLANSLRKLSGKGGAGFDPLGTVRDALGVDDITVNTDGEDAAGASVGVGKYLTDGVYLEVEQGAGASSSKARIEVEVTPSISVESSTGATGDNSVGVNWKHDY